MTEPLVSRYHAELVRVGDEFLLRDRGSTNGCFVNDTRVAEQMLADGDCVRFGNGGPEVVFHLVADTDQYVAPAPPPPGTTENLIESLSAVLDAHAASPDEEANIRCILSESYLKKGQLDAAADSLAQYRDTATLSALSPQLQATISLRLGDISIERKRPDEAVPSLRHAVDLYATLEDQPGLEEAHASLGRALIGTRELLAAREQLHRALLAARRSGNDLIVARSHLALGRVDWKEGDLEGARYHWSRAGRISERSTDVLLKAQVKLQLAFVLYAEGRFAEAAPAYEDVISEFEAIGNVPLLLVAYSGLSRVLVRQGMWVATERLLQPRVALARQHKQTKAEAIAVTDKAELRSLQGQDDEALRVIQKAVALHGSTVYARTQRIYGRIEASRGNLDEAIRQLERGLIAARAKGSLEEQVLVGLELALVLIQVRDFERAEHRLVEAESITSLDPALALMGRALYTRGTLLAATGQAPEANRCFTQSLTLFTTIGDPYRLGLAHAALGGLRTQMGRHGSARAHLEEAREIFSRLGAAGELARVRERLASTMLLDVKPAMTSPFRPLTRGLSMLTTLPGGPQDGDTQDVARPLRVLLAAANEQLAVTLKRGLEVENYLVERVAHGKAALDHSLAEDSKFDLLLLDALLEFHSGFDVCRALRQRDVDVPVILLGSRQSVEDKIDALHVGADDYLSQNGIVLEELLAKMEALLR